MALHDHYEAVNIQHSLLCSLAEQHMADPRNNVFSIHNTDNRNAAKCDQYMCMYVCKSLQTVTVRCIFFCYKEKINLLRQIKKKSNFLSNKTDSRKLDLKRKKNGVMVKS